MPSTTGSVAIFKTKLYQMILAATEKINNSHLMHHKPIFLDLDSDQSGSKQVSNYLTMPISLNLQIASYFLFFKKPYILNS